MILDFDLSIFIRLRWLQLELSLPLVLIMKLTFFAFSFVSLPTLFAIVKGQSSLTLWLPLPSDDGSGDIDSLSIPSPTAWVDPLGTASDGSETTFIYNEIDSGDAALFGDAQTGTEVVTTSFTMIASASGFRIPDVASMSAVCTLESSDSGGCVYIAPADVGGTSLVTVTETGLPVSFYEVAISAATQAASGSSSGSPSAATSGTAGAQNGVALNQQINLCLLGSITLSLLVGICL
ncbi:hypothetical protein DFJ43DRAFT_1103116 [Lentinula guzmanii]|uniref:Uncharacterized protein n=1 Tax=Lentinula guzmanii TaxID=2804957 RepID=A0AA38JDW8_9AGAR|nr:hypothetical protein DFJ43DRAFT_1103116 [Lentinula guzmanii]